MCNGSKIWTHRQVPNSKAWWRRADTLWGISDQNTLPTKCGFLVELSFTLQTSQDILALCSGHSVIWADVGVDSEIWKLQNPSSSNREKTESFSSGGPPRIHPGGYLTACDIYCEGSLTVDQVSLGHGHLKNPTNWSITPAHTNASLQTNFLWDPSEWKQWYHGME